MVSDWDEIKRLAADFQKLQLTSSFQKLSERNCVEIVTLLVEKKYIDVIFTNDGKEYVTPDHLEKEILDELAVKSGRVNLVEISKILNIDLLKINSVAEKIVKEKKMFLVLGQLLNEAYIIHVATEINEKLGQSGEISISDLAILFDLPSDFLQNQIIEKYIGNIIRGRQDPNNPAILFTQYYILRCKSKIRGALAAITRPIPISTIIQQIQIHEKIFHSLIDEISPAGNITSKLARAQYIPHIYAKMQNDWVTTFFAQNGFLEYDAILKLGISDPKQFIRKQFPDENITFLKNCAVGSKITELTLVSALNECTFAKSYIDVSTILPSIMSQEEMHELILSTLPMNNQNKYKFLGTIVFSTEYLNNLIFPCNNIINSNVKNIVESGVYQQYLVEKNMGNARNQLETKHFDPKTDKRDERRKRTLSTKTGGGSHGREIKLKSTKKSQRMEKGGYYSNEEDSIEKEKQVLEIISIDEIETCIETVLQEEGLEHLIKKISELFYNRLNQEGLAAAQKLQEASPQTQRRQNHSLLQEKLNVLLVDIRLYEKGLRHFSTDVQLQLVKYLLKTLGNDICNEIALYISKECNLNTKNTTMSAEQRNKVAQDCDPEYKNSLTNLLKVLNKNSIEEFLEAAEVALKSCGMILKKVDKKKDKLLLIQHKEKLCQQLLQTEDSAIILHLSVLLLFTIITGNILHASGKFVSNIISFLQPLLVSEHYQSLLQFHDLVLKLLYAGNDTEQLKNEMEQLKICQQHIVNMVTSYEKSKIKNEE